MSILIKGIEMPKSCLSCPLQGGTVDCRLTQKTYNWNLTERPSDCPLVPVPSYEELLKAAKAMHTWIFLNSYDEQEAYGECGLSDEMNAVLGYAGSFILPEEGE